MQKKKTPVNILDLLRNGIDIWLKESVEGIKEGEYTVKEVRDALVEGLKKNLSLYIEWGKGGSGIWSTLRGSTEELLLQLATGKEFVYKSEFQGEPWGVVVPSKAA